VENSEQEQCRKSINIKFFRKWRIKRRDGMPKLRVKYFLDFFQWDFLRDEKEQNSLRNGYMYTFLWFVFEKKKFIIQGVLRGLLPQNSCPVFLLFLRGITFRPQSSYSVVFFAILSVLRCDTANQRIRWIAIGQKGTNWEENLANRQCWTPIVFQNVQADDSLTVDVAVVDACAKCHFRWLEWVLRGKVNI